MKRVVVCTPKHEYALASNLEKHNIGELGNPKIAIQQHDTLKSKLREFGAEVMDIPELDEHPNSVFTRDSAFFIKSGYNFFCVDASITAFTMAENTLKNFSESYAKDCFPNSFSALRDKNLLY